jgi:hypothetical protein
MMRPKQTENEGNIKRRVRETLPVPKPANVDMTDPIRKRRAYSTAKWSDLCANAFVRTPPETPCSHHVKRQKVIKQCDFAVKFM